MERYRQGLNLVIEMLRRANPRDFRADASTLQKIAELPQAAVILFETNYQGYRGGKSPTTHPDFVIEDINAGEAIAYMLLAEGLDELPMREALLRNVIIKYARELLFLRNVDGIRLDNVRVNGTTLPEFPPMTPPDAPRLKISI